MTLSPDEAADVAFVVRNLVMQAKQMPCREAAKLLRGFILIAGPDDFPEIRALFQSLNACDQQLELLAAK